MACTKLAGKVVYKREVITVQDVYANIIKKVKIQVEKARKALARAEDEIGKQKDSYPKEIYGSSYIRNSRPTLKPGQL